MGHFDRKSAMITASEWRSLQKISSHVADTVVSVGDESAGYHVSTVWLGIAHGYRDGFPLIFETTLFSNVPGHRSFTLRYAAEEEAHYKHDMLVKQLMRRRFTREI